MKTYLLICAAVTGAIASILGGLFLGLFLCYFVPVTLVHAGWSPWIFLMSPVGLFLAVVVFGAGLRLFGVALDMSDL